MILSFNVFEDKLKDGRKTQTIRPKTPYWNKIYNKFQTIEGINRMQTKSGYINQDYRSYMKKDNRWYIPLQLWWKAQSMKLVEGKRDAHRIFPDDIPMQNMICKKIQDITLAEWVRDGFQSNNEGHGYLARYLRHPCNTFASMMDLLNLEVYLIQWELPQHV